MTGPGVNSPEDEGRRAVVVDARDNVATLVDDLSALRHLASGDPVTQGVPYGHKVAIAAISAGSPIVKYGVTIGRATVDIAVGDHVHIHNVDEPGG